uniref:Uncharacterized protein n=1 Tax=Anopheles atroparvus TaxID=41427 RepID=A0A182J2H0_ANOAO
MLERKARPGYRKILKTSAKTLIVIEAILFGVSYAGWYRLNTNRVYLGIFGGIGYGLLELTKPSEEKLKELKYPGSVETEEKSKKALFMKKLEQASREEPIYLKKKTDQ